MGKWKHRISKIDEITRTAMCEACGLVKVKRQIKNGRVRWLCREMVRTKEKQRIENHGRASKKQCARCGFIPIHPCQMDIHHKDYDRTNDDPSNFEVLCANCHRLEIVDWNEQSVNKGLKRKRSGILSKIADIHPVHRRRFTEQEKRERKRIASAEWRHKNPEYNKNWKRKHRVAKSLVHRKQISDLPPGATLPLSEDLGKEAF